ARDRAARRPAGQRPAMTASRLGFLELPTGWDRRKQPVGGWIGLLFALGSLCFAVAAVASMWASVSRPAIGVTFFVGSLFFTAAGYLQYAQAANAPHGAGPGVRRRRWRPASWEPRRIDWLATL